jgi:hypothetical protein
MRFVVLTPRDANRNRGAAERHAAQVIAADGVADIVPIDGVAKNATFR